MILGATRVLLKINDQTSWAGCKLKWISDEITYQPNSFFFFFVSIYHNEYHVHK